MKAKLKPDYVHPDTIASFEAIYKQEYRQELESSERWIKWCEEQGDTHGMNFHQGMQSAHNFHNIKMGQLLSVLKQTSPNQFKPENHVEQKPVCTCGVRSA